MCSLIFFLNYMSCQHHSLKIPVPLSSNLTARTRHPIIEFSYIPPYESFEKLTGQVLGVNLPDFKILIYIKVGNEWRNKPDVNNPFTAITIDGKFTCNITTVPKDHTATQITAFLIPTSYSPSLVADADSVPDELYLNSVASMEVIRDTSEIYRIITFSGYQWRVKACTELCGPGPNYFSAGAGNVWLDPNRYLHMRISKDDSAWNCSEVILQQNLGYGMYKFYIGKIDRFDEYGVLGLFTWDNAPEENHREIDIELSSWSNPDNDNTQYVIQPYDENDNMHRFNLNFNKGILHSFLWSSGEVHFESTDEDGINLNSWTYQGLDIPAPGNENPRINLWLCNPDSAAQEIEMVIKSFEFIPL